MIDQLWVSLPEKGSTSLSVSWSPSSWFVVQTALLQLALGLVKADAGEATFQGRPLQEWETAAYRERVAWLSQVCVSCLCLSVYVIWPPALSTPSDT